MARLRLLCEVHPSTIGGTERFLERLLPRLSRHGIDVLALSPRRGAPLRLLEDAGIEGRVVRNYDSTRASARLAALIEREQIDVAQSCYYLSTLALAAAHAGVAHVWRLGGHVRVGSGVKHAGDAHSLTRLIPMLSSRIVCNSRFVASQFTRPSRAQLTVVPNGIAIARQPPVRTRGRFCIGMVAHLTPQKRHEDFLAAAERVAGLRDNVQFELFGAAYNHPGGRADAAAILRRARALLGSGRLRISTFAEGAQDIYRRLDLLVQPSVGESCSNAVLEAMSAGVPVVAARSGGHPELIRHERSGLLVPAKDPRALARAMLRVIDDRTLADRLGGEARRQAATRFSIDKCVAQYAKIYRAAVAPTGLRS